LVRHSKTIGILKGKGLKEEEEKKICLDFLLFYFLERWFPKPDAIPMDTMLMRLFDGITHCGWTNDKIRTVNE
jgi:hypothetical protein